MEQLNEQTKKAFEEIESDEDVVFECMEYIRQPDRIKQRYNPSCGQVVAMGSTSWVLQLLQKPIKGM